MSRRSLTLLSASFASILLLGISPASAKDDPEDKKPDPLTPKFLVYGEGNIGTSATDVKNVTASGGGGLGYEGPVFRFHFSFRKGNQDTIGATVDDKGVVTPAKPTTYGRSVIDPTATSNNGLLSLGIFPFDAWSIKGMKTRIGFLTEFNFGSVNWAYPITTNGVTKIASLQAAPISFIFCPMVSSVGRTGDNRAELFGGFCLTYRYLGGEISGLENKDVLKSMVGDDRRSYYGANLTFGGRLGDLIITLQPEIIFPLTSDKIGINGFNFIPTISATAPIELNF